MQIMNVVATKVLVLQGQKTGVYFVSGNFISPHSTSIIIDHSLIIHLDKFTNFSHIYFEGSTSQMCQLYIKPL